MTRLRHWQKDATSKERFWRPRGVAIEPSLVIPAPRHGEIVQFGSRLELRWREPAVTTWRARVWDLDVRDPAGNPTEVRTLSGVLDASATADKRFGISIGELFGANRARLVAVIATGCCSRSKTAAAHRRPRAARGSVRGAARRAARVAAGPSEHDGHGPGHRGVPAAPRLLRSPTGESSHAQSCTTVTFGKDSQDVEGSVAAAEPRERRAHGPIAIALQPGDTTAVAARPVRRGRRHGRVLDRAADADQFARALPEHARRRPRRGLGHECAPTRRNRARARPPEHRSREGMPGRDPAERQRDWTPCARSRGRTSARTPRT